jgi:hypothetical protein
VLVVVVVVLLLLLTLPLPPFPSADLCETSRNDLLSSGADEVLGKPTPNGELEEVRSIILCDISIIY